MGVQVDTVSIIVVKRFLSDQEQPSTLEGAMKQMKSLKLSLKEIEVQVLTEGREWTRRRLQQQLQAQAQEAGALFPPAPTADPPTDAAHRGRRRDPQRGLRARSANG
jgi:hypothetical protein